MHFIKNGQYYKILHGSKYYRLLNPRRLFLFTIVPHPADATVTLTADGYTQVGNTISVRAGTQVSWSVAKAGIPTATGTETITEPKTIYVTIGYPSGEILFESSTPGTYNVNLLYPCAVNVDMVGAGSGGAGMIMTMSGGRTVFGSTGGGSGAYVSGTMPVEAGGYTIVVGAGSSGSQGSVAAGGNTSFNGQIAGGGGAHSTTSIGAGGSYTIDIDTIVGINGNAGSSRSGAGTASGGSSKYGGYGSGGTGRANSGGAGGDKGGDGYIKITVE